MRAVSRTTGKEEASDWAYPKSPGSCEPCIDGKLHKKKFPIKERKRAGKPLELVHSDVCGKMKNKSLSGKQYFVSFIDDYSLLVWVYVLKHKSRNSGNGKPWLRENLSFNYKPYVWIMGENICQLSSKNT